MPAFRSPYRNPSIQSIVLISMATFSVYLTIEYLQFYCLVGSLIFYIGTIWWRVGYNVVGSGEQGGAFVQVG